MARALQRALTSISLSRSRAGLEFAPFSYTRALESLTAVVPRLDRGSASFRPRLRLVSPPRFIRDVTAVKTQMQYTLSLICTVAKPENIVVVAKSIMVVACDYHHHRPLWANPCLRV